MSEPFVPRSRAPGLVLVCGLATGGAGVLLLALGRRVDGLAWVGAAVLAGGAGLIGTWAWGRRRPGGTTGPLPGGWYPAALLGIFALLFAWVLYWTKRG